MWPWGWGEVSVSFVEENEMTEVIKNEEKQEKGASLVEYALLVALIAIIAIVAIRVLGQKVSQQFSTVASQV